jgi:hypothetical protein
MFGMSKRKIHRVWQSWCYINSSVWHIDHIFPLTAFVDYELFDMKLANSLDNLRPLTGRDNFSKSSRYNKRDFEKWLESKGIFARFIVVPIQDSARISLIMGEFR